MAINVGTLVLDGNATPHQIALWLPITGATDSDAVAACTYKLKSVGSALGADGATQTGHPLFRRVDDTGFAWTIIGLRSNTQYEVTVTVSSAGDSDVVKTLTTTTRKPPPHAPRPTSTITVGTSTANIKTAIEALTAGQCIQFDDGTHTLTGLVPVTTAGTAANPIYIRGTSREGTILKDTSGRVIDLSGCDNVVLENLSVEGSSTDSDTSASSIGIYIGGQTGIVVRDVTMYGVDRAVITGDNDAASCLVYDSILVGNNLWTSAFIDDNSTWNDDGIQLSGDGNCAFRNTIKGFGDSIAVTYSTGSGTKNCHYYNNDIINSGDDLIEVDNALRNITFYDNRATNVITAMSLDPLEGGPLIYCRNQIINIGRFTFKWNTASSGMFVYSNTICLTDTNQTGGAEAGWYNSGNGGSLDHEAYGFRNNLIIYRGPGVTLNIDFGDNNPVDWTNNAWYSSTLSFDVSDNGPWSTLAAAEAANGSKTPVFSSSTAMFDNDVSTISNPWTDTVTLGADYLTEITTLYSLTLSGGTSPKAAGIVIPNVTDNFTGAAPDIGANIAGRAVPIYGNRLPSWVSALAVGDWYQIPSSAMSSCDPNPNPPGTTGPESKVRAWTGFALDTARSDLYSVANGGHGDYAGNEVDRFVLEVEAPFWEEILISTASGDITANASHYADGRPNSRHSYYGETFDEFNDRIIIFSGNQYSNGGVLDTTDSYNIGTNSYSAAATHPDIDAGVNTEGPFSCYDPYTGDIYCFANNDGAKWTRSSNLWADSGTTGSHPNAERGACAFDSARDEVFFIGGVGTDAHHILDVLANTIGTVTLSGANASDVSGADLTGMIYVPALDRYLIRKSTAGGAVYQVNPGTYEVTTFSTSGGSGVGATDNGPAGKWLYVPRLGGAIYVPVYDESSWFLKTNDAQAATPGESGGGGDGSSKLLFLRGS